MRAPAPVPSARRAAALLLALACAGAAAAPISDVAGTKHNLSSSGPGPVRATTESQICVFCHTPHAANTAAPRPLWNRELPPDAQYTGYDSGSIQAPDLKLNWAIGGTSKLCLSCHDGTLALGAVNVANGLPNQNITLQGTDPDGTMPGGPHGAQSGFTRDLGINLTNDHPISFTYNTALATADGELRDPAAVAHIGNRSPGNRPPVPLEDQRMECVSCHDPHLRDEDPTVNIKFLRLNRFQVNNPAGGAFSPASDTVCLACHDKLGAAWAQSAHADSVVADEQYKADAAALREFPAGLPVWRAACLNCHDTHTVQGARRLLREGTDSTVSPKQGGKSAIEETCYQCHTTAAQSILTNVAAVPNIETDFGLLFRMPITNADQIVDDEPHDILDSDFTETVLTLGRGDLQKRHVECTDCHNPHRLTKNRLFNRTGATTAATHNHAAGHTNIASGALRGSWGVEPIYSAASFHSLPSGYTVKRGDGGVGASTAAINTWVTREYQICLKCHSDFGYIDDNVYPVGSRPDLGSFLNGTGSGTNNLTQYTNQAKEFQAPAAHKARPIPDPDDSGADIPYRANNHRSWHPVLDNTGRTGTIRGDGTNISARFEPPWDGTADVGNQTMYCTDCHGSGNNTAGLSAPATGNPWGPHGSNNAFILRGVWSTATGTGQQATGLCFKCHDYDVYATRARQRTGFFIPGAGDDGHSIHADRIGRMRCNWCHVAVPHGWKNKALLVNLNDVGPEAGEATPREFRINTSTPFNREPYYLNAMLKVLNFRPSGQWGENDCGSRGGTGDGGGSGRDWMRRGSESCANPP